MKLEPANIICPNCGDGNYMRHLIGKNVGKLDMKCINCNSYFNFDELYKQKIAEIVKPQTNYDRLVRKSPEELAEFIWGVETAGRAYGPRGKNAWLNWLKEEAKE